MSKKKVCTYVYMCTYRHTCMYTHMYIHTHVMCKYNYIVKKQVDLVVFLKYHYAALQLRQKEEGKTSMGKQSTIILVSLSNFITNKPQR